MRRWLGVLALVGALLGAVDTSAAATAPPPPDTIDAAENVFLPEDRDLSECVGALPRPGCGSESHGGWRQVLVLVAIGSGVAFVGWRVARAVRHTVSED